MRISDWSSDVCSSDLVLLAEISGSDTYVHLSSDIGDLVAKVVGVHHFTLGAAQTLYFAPSAVFVRSEERRVGKECVSTGRSRWSPYHYKKKIPSLSNCIQCISHYKKLKITQYR